MIQKKSTYFLFALLILILIPTQINPAIAQETNDLATYQGAEYGFQLEYPKNWNVKESDSTRGHEVRFEQQKIDPAQCEAYFAVIVDSVPPPTFDDFINESLARIFTDITNVHIIVSDYSTLAGNQAYTVVYTGLPPITKPICTEFQFWEEYVLKDNIGYTIGYIAATSDFEQVVNTFEKMIDSFSFGVLPLEAVAEPEPETMAEPEAEAIAEPEVETVEIPTTNYPAIIQLNLVPSSIEPGKAVHSIGYLSVLDTAGLPILSPANLIIKLDSSNTGVATVPATTVIPANQDFATFDVTTGDIEGEIEISAEFQGQTFVSSLRVGGESVGVIAEDVELVINLPSIDMHVNSETPFSVYMHSNGTILQAPRDIPVKLSYESSLVELSPELVIKRGDYYGLGTIKTLKNQGNAFIKAITDTPPLETVTKLKVSSTKPVALFVQVFPDKIAESENSIDIFVSLLDAGNSPTLAPENIKLELFSDDILFGDSINKVLFPRGATILKGEFGFHMKHDYIFPRGLISLDKITVGASAEGLGVDTTSFELVESLSIDDPKSKDLVLKIFSSPTMPPGANAIIVYQINTIEHDDDDPGGAEQTVIDVVTEARDAAKASYDLKKAIYDALKDNPNALPAAVTTAKSEMDAAKVALDAHQKQLDTLKSEEKKAASQHQIDSLDEGELYPVQAISNYSPGKLVENLEVVSTDTSIITIDDPGLLLTAKSYGTSLISSADKTGEVTISAVLGGVGASSNKTKVESSIKAESTKIFSPLGESKIVFNNEGNFDLLLVTLDIDGRPASSETEIEYLLTPINDFLEISPKDNFARMSIPSSLFGRTLETGSANITAVPIGIEAQTGLEVATEFELVPSSSAVTPFMGVQSLTGINTVNQIGVVQLTDFFGNAVPVSNDLTVALTSSEPDLIEVPNEVTIPTGKSYVNYPVTILGAEGISEVTASAKGLLSESTPVKFFSNELLIYVEPISTPLSFNEDVPVRVFIDDVSLNSVVGATVQFIGNQNLTVTPPTLTTDNTGGVSTTIKAVSGPTVSLTIKGSKSGYLDVEKTLLLDVTGAEIIGTQEFLGLPTWVMYVMIAGAVAGGGFGAYMFLLRKPKEVTGEEEEEEEI